jgi:acylphosphatase
MAEQRERRTVHFAGNVQGVGFRYTTHQIAQGFAVQGFVQNLFDGRVLLVVEGLPSEIDLLLASLRGRLRQHIRGETTDRSAPTGEFSSFSIQH